MTIILGMCDPSGKGALLPHHPGSAGHRLWKISEMDLDVWLSSFTRMNLVKEKRWNDKKAVREAVRFLAKRKGEPVIALGSLVRKALEASGGNLSDVHFFPHPSGRNLAYNSSEARERLRSILNYFATDRSTD